MHQSLSIILGSHLRYFDNTRLATTAAVVGFDGFIDEMMGIINSRAGDAIELVPTIAAFGSMVTQAAGRSFGRELAAKRTEAGGNAPNLAEGLSAMGMRVHFYGTLGEPIDPVFEPFARACASCTTLGACGRTLALEFSDGKLMLNNTSRLGELVPARFEAMMADGEFERRCRGAAVIGFANWSRYPNMTACWRTVTERVLSKLTHRPFVIVDLADPSSHSGEAIRAMFDVVGAMARTCRVVFGANLNESGTLLRAFGEWTPEETGESMAEAAERLRRKIGVQMFMVHSQKRAAAAWSDPAGGNAWAAGRTSIEGTYNPNPVRTTGVGDRFNAGVAAGLIGGMPPEGALALGCAAGLWFVSKGTPLRLEDINREWKS